MDLVVLLLRLVVGFYLFIHGAEKLFGWFGGPGLTATIGTMGSRLGFRPATFWAVVGPLSEVIGGSFLVLGLLAPLGAVASVAAMLVAVGLHWRKGPMAQRGGYELALTYLVVALGVGVIGVGAYSLDGLLGIRLPEPLALQLGLVLAVGGAIVAFASRRAVVPQPAT